METAKQMAHDVLRAIGFRVDEIPESNDRRADLRASDVSSTYFIEVKQKIDDIEALRTDANQMATGEVISHSKSLSHHNRIAAILKDGRNQLDQTPKSTHDFSLIWFAADGIDRDVYWKRAFATFYGFVQLLALEPPGDEIIDCFYFDYSASWSMPTVDAMVLVDVDNLQLCLNEFSPKLDLFRQSLLCTQLSDAVVDPLHLLANNSIIALHTDASRRSEDLVLEELFRQTGVRYATVRPQQHSASAMVKRPGLT
jgi:hypothetical protein